MGDIFPTKKHKILLGINIVLITLYFVFDIASIALFVSPQFNILWKFISLIIPWSIIFFTAPRTNNGYKPSVSIWGVILLFYYLYEGNIQIKGNRYVSELMGYGLIEDDIYINMIIAIIISCLIIFSGLGIIYRMKLKHHYKNESI